MSLPDRAPSDLVVCSGQCPLRIALAKYPAPNSRCASLGSGSQRNSYLHHQMCISGFFDRLQRLHRNRRHSSTGHFCNSGCFVASQKSVNTFPAKSPGSPTLGTLGLDCKPRHHRVRRPRNGLLQLSNSDACKFIQYE